MPDNLTDEEIQDIAVERFRALRAVIYKILPNECLLRPKLLGRLMVEMLDITMFEQGMIETADICSLCSKIECPYNNVPDRDHRILVLQLLNSGTGKTVV